MQRLHARFLAHPIEPNPPIGIEAGRIEQFFLRSLQAPVAVGDEAILHVFVVGLERDLSTREPYDEGEADVGEQYEADNDRVLHATLKVSDDGVLAPLSERPVRLTRSHLRLIGYETSDPAPYNDNRNETHPLNRTQAGAALAVDRRGFVRWLYPTREGLSVRTVWSR